MSACRNGQVILCIPADTPFGFADVSLVAMQGLLAEHDRVSRKICSRISDQAPHDPIR